MGIVHGPAHRARSFLLPAMSLAAVASAGLLAWYYVWPTARPPSDPRLSYRGPFKNVDPDVAYVSDAMCAECHADIAKSFSHHPMARTLMPISQVESPPLDAGVNNPFNAFGQRFAVVAHGDQVLHTRSAFDGGGKLLFRQELPVHFAIGSGTHAHSYLWIDGPAVRQTPITWFAQKKRWDLSPGFTPNVLAGRRVGADCLFCHSNAASEDAGDETTYRQPVFPNGYGIGCQRCHGPGAEHVKAPGNRIDTDLGRLDPTIVNPKHLPPHLRESICWQCHLEGDVRVLRHGRQRFDFRPGMPLEDFIGVYVDAAEAGFDDVVNHVEQMTQSRCYQKSAGPGKMGCVTCHDPHEKSPPADVVSHYRSACLQCHTEDACSLPRPQRLARHQDDHCAACHMPAFATANITHVSSTDHRIPRTAGPRRSDRPPTLRMDDVRDLVSVFEHQRGKSDPELGRDRALAAAMLARRGRRLLQPFEQELAEAARRDPGDLVVRAQLGLTLLNRQEAPAALTQFNDVLARQPDDQWALLGHAIACGQLGKIDESLASWRRLVALFPSQAGFRAGLVETLMKQSHWEATEQEARAWLAVDPGSTEGRAKLRDSLARLGKDAEAREQNRILVKLLGH
jgi:predicted CXXCH cytochrome family protein